MTPLLLPLLLVRAPVDSAPQVESPVDESPVDGSAVDGAPVDGAVRQDDPVLVLSELQARVDRVLAVAVPATVGLRVGRQSGTGVLVSADGLVLTAGHVSSAPGIDVVVILHDGTELKGRTLGLNPTRDSGMVLLEDGQDLPFVPVPPAGETRLGSWCVGLGHPGGYEEGRPPVPRLGRLRADDGPFVETDCPVIFGDSGGPLFDLDGNLIGIHSRIEEDVSVNFHVPMSAYRLGWERLRGGEEWRRGGVRLGVRGVEDEPSGGAILGPISEGRPAASAGLLAGDVALVFAGEPVRNAAQLRAYLDDVAAGVRVSLVVRRGDETRTVDVEFGEELSR